MNKYYAILLALSIGCTQYAEPYAIQAFGPSKAMLAECRKDPNCMDVIDLALVDDCSQWPEGSDAFLCCIAPELDPNLCGGAN